MLACVAGAMFWGGAALADPVGFPREISLGPTLSLAGPGLAYRQFVSPEFGFQVGANSLIFTGPGSFGGQVLYSPVHSNGFRAYASAGFGLWDEDLGIFGHPQGTGPSLGLGISSGGEYVTAYFDLCVVIQNFNPAIGDQTTLIPYPQVGVLVNL